MTRPFSLAKSRKGQKNKISRYFFRELSPLFCKVWKKKEKEKNGRKNKISRYFFREVSPLFCKVWKKEKEEKKQNFPIFLSRIISSTLLEKF